MSNWKLNGLLSMVRNTFAGFRLWERLLLLGILFGMSATGHAATGTLAGVVTRSDGTTAITGAAIEVFQGVATVAVATTDGAGRYSITLNQGAYNVQASAIG